jgi:DNA polymerase III epsilon subunit family exonuclease
MNIPRIIQEHCYVVLDIETTGLSRKTDEIVQIAMAQVDYGVQRLRTVAHVRPSVPIKPGAAAVHGLTEERLAQCTTFDGIAKDVVDFIGGRTLVGYNVLSFDAPILTRQLQTARSETFAFDALDVYLWEKRYGGVGGHSLGAAAARWDVPNEVRHDALGDLRTCWGVFVKLALAFPELGDARLGGVLEMQKKFGSRKTGEVTDDVGGAAP